MLSIATLLNLGLIAPLSFLPSVHAHGQIKGVMANGVWNDGPNIYFDGDKVNDKTVTRKMFKASGPAYLTYNDFSDNTKMACESADPAPESISITAGSTLSIYWEGATSELLNKPGTGVTNGTNPWVHAMGPVSNYIASCSGSCSSFSADSAGSAGWTKLSTFGLDTSRSISDDLRETIAEKPEEYYPTADEGRGLWGIAKLVEDGSKWDVKIPSGLKRGEYLIRHELAAVHSPKSSGGSPQLYVACIQISVTDGGDDELPGGTLAGSFYDEDGYLANYNVYTAGTVFKDIGPAVWSVVSGGGSTSFSMKASTSIAKVKATSSMGISYPVTATATTFFDVPTETTPAVVPPSSPGTTTATTFFDVPTETTPAVVPPSSSSSSSTSTSSLASTPSMRKCKPRKRSVSEDEETAVEIQKRAPREHGQMKRRLGISGDGDEA